MTTTAADSATNGPKLAGATPETQQVAHIPLNFLLRSLKDGDEHGWNAEFTFLRTEHADELAALRTSIEAVGILEPVIVGSDDRLWDGHHRLCVAHDLGLASVPVTFIALTDDDFTL